MGWAVGLVGAGVGALGQKKQGELDEKTAEANARLANYQADDAVVRGNKEEERFRRQLAGFMGTQRNAIASRNVELSGSALRLLEDSAQLGEEDAMTIRNEAAREAWGYRHQANESSRYGKQARSNANMAATGSLLTGGAQAYGQWRDSQ